MICLRAGLIRGFVLFKSRKLQQKLPRFWGRLLIPEKYFRKYVVLLHTTLSCYIIENLILDNECNQLCCPGTLSLQDPSYHLYSPMPSLPKLCACYLWRDLQRCKYSVSHNICFKCFATYNSLFKDPDDFRGRFNTMRVLNSSPAVQRLVAVIQHPQPDGGDVLEADDKEVKNLLESAIATSEQQPSSQGIKQLN